jgi:DNA-binding transcriptional regulator GbsR (MarR family)
MDTLIQQFGVVFHRFGLRRSLGRIWAVVYLSPEPVSQGDLVELLGLSAGLVSSSLRELVNLSALQTTTVEGSRRTHYVAEDSLLRMLASILAKRELDAIRDLRNAIQEARRVFRRSHYGEVIANRLRGVEESAELYATLAALVPSLARLPVGAAKRAVRILKSVRPGEESKSPSGHRSRASMGVQQ